MMSSVFMTLVVLYLICTYEAFAEQQKEIPQLKVQTRMKRSKSDNALNSNQYTPAPYLNKMLQNSQNSQSEAVQLVGLGSAVGSALGPVGTVVGGLVGGILCIIVCHDDPPPPNKPPYFTSCPKSGQKAYAEEGKTKATVSWQPPTATDPEDGTLSVYLQSGLLPGSEFDRGDHTIIYSATDHNGVSTSCFFSFTIVVMTCDPPQWPINGYIRCDKSEVMIGTSCTVGCFSGYKMSPQNSRIKCVKNQNNTSMDLSIPSCQEITCPVNVAEMRPQHGTALCTHQSHKYDTACFTQCDRGYTLDKMMFSICESNGLWSRHLPDCKDSEPPEITYCPNTIYSYTNRNSKEALVNWTEPSASDNSKNVTVHQIKGPKSGFSFRVGITEIRYQATDSNGNKSPECIFFVVVEELRCNPPLISDPYMIYRCPDGFTYGSKCNLRCMGKFPLVGNDSIVCEKNSTNGHPSTYWNKGPSDPYCKRIPCKDLPAPINGAISCDTWMFGRQCQMQCSRKYDIPAVGSGFTGIFTCSEKEGVFKPLNTVPNCTESRLPGHIETLGEFFYYTGSCSDPTVLEEIKLNFIQQMKILEKNGYAGVCSDTLQCNVGNVSVTCGPRSRKRRSINSDEISGRFKRSDSEIRVEIKISSLFLNSNSSTSDSFEFAKQIQKNILKKIEEVSNSGKLTVSGLTPNAGSFVLGFSAPVCPEGLYIRMSSLSCVPCISGSFLNVNNRGRPVCTPCPRGFYKEDEFEIHCTQCPDETSTVETGSTHLTDCIDKCGPGEYSDTGLSPCSPCAKSTYQSKTMSTSCLQCPTGLTTAFQGSTDVQNCTDFDLMFKYIGNKIDIRKPSGVTNIQGVTIMLWMLSAHDTFDMTVFQSKTLTIRLKEKLIIGKGLLRNWASADVFFENGTWMHLAVVIKKNHPAVSVYVNGNQKYQSSSSVSITAAELSTAFEDAFLKQNIGSGMSISGYQIVPNTMSSDEISKFAKTCHSKSPESVVTMDDLISKPVRGIDVIVPSQCDSVNECESDPCNGHRCVNKVKGYICQCSNGYTGKNCEIKPDYCKHDPCQNGASCANTPDGNYTCTCKDSFKGMRCEKKIVNGGWSPWNEFSECTVSCNGGTKFRKRTCNSPRPDPDGIPCNVSDAIQRVPCNEEKCPSCPHLKRGFGNVPHCHETDDGHEICKVTCRPGYSFLPGNSPLPEYKCGKNTSYIWNGKPPACGKLDIPDQITTETIVSYNAPVGCDIASKASQFLKVKLESSIQCAQNKTCIVAVEAKDCSSTLRKKRTANSQTQHVTLTTATAEKFDIESLAQSNQTNVAAKKYIIGLSELEFSVQQLNGTDDILKIVIDGNIFTPTGQTTTSIVRCPNGQGRMMFLCADCPSGTHSSSSGKCVLCNKGNYQDEPGQTSCKSCPYGKTTAFVGSQSQLDCSETLGIENKERHQPTENGGKNGTLIAVTTISVVLLLGMMITLGIFAYKKITRKRFKENAQRIGSWASLSMVMPNNEYIAMESKPKFKM